MAELTTIALDRNETYDRLKSYKFESRSDSFDAAVSQLLDEVDVEASQGE